MYHNMNSPAGIPPALTANFNDSYYADASAPVLEELMLEPTDSYEQKMKKLDSVLRRYNVSVAQADELLRVAEYKMIFICDDSGSMGRRTKEFPSRWAELKHTVQSFLEIAVYLGNGVDVIFLNREAILNVTSPQDPRLLNAFRTGPYGSTPLVERIRETLSRLGHGSKVIFMIATDGEPDTGRASFNSIVQDAVHRGYHIQFLACTDDKSEIGFLNNIDKKFVEVDVMDDFLHERKQVLRTGKFKRFNRADYVVKGMLGPICSKFDKMDEGCCTIL
eukprot:TRINITY_DN19058_c0_g1_i1.p1 TRINITY_DN19058_c0_g1~~TRINITY_DN19058_c0_g1_i1.p1  ORF type:complete len:277 (+),score=29.52 TRINITY_DN19058_c0_g1_i1:12-842(+)